MLARRRLAEGLDGITRLHALIGEHLPEEWAEGEPAQAAAMVKVGIEKVWDRTRHVLRLRSALRDFFPAALTAFPDLDVPPYREQARLSMTPK